MRSEYENDLEIALRIQVREEISRGSGESREVSLGFSGLLGREIRDQFQVMEKGVAQS